MFLSINGILKEENNLKISVHDRSFLFGDNVFETLLCHDKKIIESEKHIERLFNSAKKIYIPIQYRKDQIESFINDLIEKNNLNLSIVRIMLTRGEGGRGISIQDCKAPNLIITVKKIKKISKEEYINGKSVNTIQTNKTSVKKFINIKSGALYLENILAKYESNKEGNDDALMLDEEENILECTTANIFWIKNNILYTPSLKLNILPGITRKTIICLAKGLNVEIEEGKYKLKDIECADEIFMTYSSAGIMPITKLNNLIISNGKIGRMTLSLLESFWSKYDIKLKINENKILH